MTAKELQIVRDRLRLTQGELAIKAGVSLSLIQKLEGGTLTPRPVSVRKLAEAYGVTPEEIESACGITRTSPA